MQIEQSFKKGQQVLVRDYGFNDLLPGVVTGYSRIHPGEVLVCPDGWKDSLRFDVVQPVTKKYVAIEEAQEECTDLIEEVPNQGHSYVPVLASGGPPVNRIPNSVVKPPFNQNSVSGAQSNNTSDFAPSPYESSLPTPEFSFLEQAVSGEAVGQEILVPNANEAVRTNYQNPSSCFLQQPPQLFAASLSLPPLDHRSRAFANSYAQGNGTSERARCSSPIRTALRNKYVKKILSQTKPAQPKSPKSQLRHLQCYGQGSGSRYNSNDDEVFDCGSYYTPCITRQILPGLPQDSIYKRKYVSDAQGQMQEVDIYGQSDPVLYQ